MATNREIAYVLRMRNRSQADVRAFVQQVRKMTQDVKAQLNSLSRSKNPLKTATDGMTRSLKTVSASAKATATAVIGASSRMNRSASGSQAALASSAQSYRQMAHAAQQTAQQILQNHKSLIASVNRLRQAYANPINGPRMRPAANQNNTTAGRGNNSGAANAASVRQTTSALGSGIEDARGALAQFISAASIGLLIRELVDYADTWTMLGNRIAAVGVPLKDVPDRLQQIADIARRSRNSIEDVGGGFARLTIASSEIGASQAQVARVTETLAKSMTISGASTQEAQAALIQFGQALASGVLQGDELRSLRENAPLVAKAIADEFGVSIGQLKQLGSEGKLTADRVFEAIYRASSGVDAAFGKTTITVGNAFTNIRTSLIQAVGEFDKFYGISTSVANALNSVSEAIVHGDKLFKVIAASVAGFVAVVGGGAVFGLTAAAVTMLGGPLVAAAAAVAALTGAFVYFQDTLVQLGPLTGTLGSIIEASMRVSGTYVMAVVDAIGRNMKIVGDGLSKDFQTIETESKSLGVRVEEVWRSIVTRIQGFFAYLKDGASNAFTLMVDDLAHKLEGFLNTFVATYNTIADVLRMRVIGPFDFRAEMISVERRNEIFANSQKTMAQYVADAERAYDALRAKETEAKAALDKLLDNPTSAGQASFLADVQRLTTELDEAKAKAEALRRVLERDQRGDKGSRDEAAELKLISPQLDDGKKAKDIAREIERANDQLRNHVLQLKQDEQLLGLVGKGRERVTQLMQFENQLMGMENLTQSQRIALLQEYNTALTDRVQKVQAYQTAANGAREAANEYAISAGNAFENAKTFMSNTLSSLENSFAGLFTAGKGGWKEMVDAMLSDFMRFMVVRPLLAKLATAMGFGKQSNSGQVRFLTNAVSSMKGIPSGAAANLQLGANSVKSLKTDIVADVLAAGSGTATGSLVQVGNFVSRGAGKVDQNLVSIMQEAAKRSNMNVEAYSGFRPGDGRYHGKGMAMDVGILGSDGKRLPNYQDGANFRQYEILAQNAKMVADERGLGDQLRWGGYFSGPKGKYGANDAMHFDMVGKATGMGGGSFESGLNAQQRAYFPDAQSQGMGMGSNAAVQVIQQQTAALQTIQTNTAQQNTISQQQLTGIQQTAQNAQTVNAGGQPMNVQQMTVSNMAGAGGSSPIAGAVQQATPQIQANMTGAFQNVASNTQGTFRNIFQTLGGAFKGIFGGVFKGLEGIFQSIIGAIGGKDGGGGGLGSIIGIIGSIVGLHKGGIAGGTGQNGGNIQRHVSAMAWAGAPKFHTGGIVGGLKSGERRAVLKDTEAVMPTVRLPDGSFGVKAIGGGETKGSGGGSYVFSPTTKIEVKGAGGSAEDHEALGAQLSAQVNAALEVKMNEFVAKHSRSGGMLNRNGF